MKILGFFITLFISIPFGLIFTGILFDIRPEDPVFLGLNLLKLGALSFLSAFVLVVASIAILLFKE